MIDKFCDLITEKIKSKVTDIDEERELIINFGVRLIFGELPKILILFIIGFLLSMGWQTLLLFFLIAPYRSFTGGIHLKTHLGCMITTSILYLLPIILSKYILISDKNILYILAGLITIFSIIIIARYAPADTEDVPILSSKVRKKKRIISYVAFSLGLLISIIISNNTISNILILSNLLQTITITRFIYKVTNNKYGYEVYNDTSYESV